MGGMEMIYDGTCGFCKRSMAWFLAFDGLRQIQVRDFRTNPSPVVSDEKMHKALYTVLPDGRALPGLRGLSLRRAARAGLVVAGPVLLYALAKPLVRPSDLQLDRRQPQPALVV